MFILMRVGLLFLAIVMGAPDGIATNIIPGSLHERLTPDQLKIIDRASSTKISLFSRVKKNIGDSHRSQDRQRRKENVTSVRSTSYSIDKIDHFLENRESDIEWSIMPYVKGPTISGSGKVLIEKCQKISDAHLQATNLWSKISKIDWQDGDKYSDDELERNFEYLVSLLDQIDHIFPAAYHHRDTILIYSWWLMTRDVDISENSRTREFSNITVQGVKIGDAIHEMGDEYPYLPYPYYFLPRHGTIVSIGKIDSPLGVCLDSEIEIYVDLYTVSTSYGINSAQIERHHLGESTDRHLYKLVGKNPLINTTEKIIDFNRREIISPGKLSIWAATHLSSRLNIDTLVDVNKLDCRANWTSDSCHFVDPLPYEFPPPSVLYDPILFGPLNRKSMRL